MKKMIFNIVVLLLFSASIIIAKAKQFDDGLFAVVECLCQKGSKNFVSKIKLLQGMAESLKELSKEKEISVPLSPL